ncbi:MAG: transglutaminase-like domain-containing protein [Planctomycetales bacterium]|nr:transglutaminase-like domain-containing protein [Planctomycetales bacterium]
MSYAADCSVIVSPPYKAKVLKVWIPVPPSNNAQIVKASEFSTFPLDVKPKIGTEKTYGNQFAYFEFKEPQGAQIIRHKFQIQTYELRWNIEPEQVKSIEKWPASFDSYRRSESQAVVLDDRFQKLITQVVPKRKNPLLDLSLVMNWVGENFTYDHRDASLAADALKAFDTHRGHCSDYHGFCAAMGRALGYPTRVTYGINTFPKNSPSHCKLEAFLPPYGWVSFDVSETQKLVAAIKKEGKLADKEKADLITAASQRLTSGFRDNTWFLQTVGTDYDLEPPATKRVPVVRTAYIEADGVALPDPDPADPLKREFAWMTAYEFKTEAKVVNPFVEYSSLKK